MRLWVGSHKFSYPNPRCAVPAIGLPTTEQADPVVRRGFGSNRLKIGQTAQWTGEEAVCSPDGETRASDSPVSLRKAAGERSIPR
jgi:hypothetical protein